MAKLNGTQCVSFQREPTWITQSLGQALGVGDEVDSDGEEFAENGDQEMANGNTNGDVGVDMTKVDPEDEEVGSNFNPNYTARDKRRFRNPEKLKHYRKMLQHGMNKGFRIVCLQHGLPTRHHLE